MTNEAEVAMINASPVIDSAVHGSVILPAIAIDSLGRRGDLCPCPAHPVTSRQAATAGT